MRDKLNLDKNRLIITNQKYDTTPTKNIYKTTTYKLFNKIEMRMITIETLCENNDNNDKKAYKIFTKKTIQSLRK